jgi:redox-sensitive bicupin YhaK (pirin superfamily)
MLKTIYRASDRGHANHGWLNAWHSFSFAGFQDPARTHFGLLRVWNDDTVAPGMGFGTHPHDNMEIVTIPLQGALEHQDSTGGKGVIYKNEVQVMSAGSGLSHSEYNHSKTEPV